MPDLPYPAARRDLDAPKDLLLNDAKAVSPTMRQLARQLKLAAETEATVFIVGESGTGKELAAQAIHRHSARRERPFVPVNCGAIGGALAYAELFGHEKGSFTGAHIQTPGYFEYASGGTLFLDEVTEMPDDIQVQFLRVLETGTYHRVGGGNLFQADVRIICASNRDPIAAMKEGRLRHDLLHRLLVIPLRIPPLRERGDDIRAMALQFLTELNESHQLEKSFSPRMLNAIENYEWPGNVRELLNVIQRAYVLSDDVLDMPLPTRLRQLPEPVEQEGQLSFRVGTTLEELQQKFILATLAQNDNDKKRTADVLGISLKTLYNRLDRYAKSR